MQLRNARLCLDCEEVHDAEQRPLKLLEQALPDLPREELWLRMRSMFACVGPKARPRMVTWSALTSITLDLDPS